ncbi:MAG: AAA family ATPase [Cocleimonas sp.]|nr:AAA family ATPase [Cocleimonas sp.]
MSKKTYFHYPFTAVIGQDSLKTALLLVASDPALGGVLLSGNRGTAKSTLARSLADLLDDRSFVNCPLGVSEDRLLGSLDVEHALANGQLKFSAGLFAQAHEGVLYVDEINLLPDHLVDLLLDVCASGINYLERDGISHQHPAQFILIGSMNPEEGTLRPQLLDRFGLFIEIKNNPDLQQRLDIVEARLSFDADPINFCRQYAEEQTAVKQLVQTARQMLQQVIVSPKCKLEIARRCLEAGVEGVRADLALFRAARANTALRGDNKMLLADIDAVAALVLAHRRQDVLQPQQAETHSKKNHSNNSSDSTNKNNTISQSNPPSHDLDKKSSQGDWGKMPVEDVQMGLQRQLDPSAFSDNNPALSQKKKQ